MSWIAGWPAELAPSLAVDVLVRGGLVLLVALIAVRSLGSASAATRHGVWAVTFGLLLLMPLGNRMLPTWDLHAPEAVLPARSAVLHRAVESAPPSSPEAAAGAAVLRESHRGVRAGSDSRSRPSVGSEHPARESSLVRSLFGMGVIVWLLGGMLLLGRLAVHRARIKRLVRRGRRVPPGWLARITAAFPGRKVGVVLSGETPVPLTTGFLRPTIVLPAGAEEWPGSLLRSALRHELAHVDRRDYATHMASRIACALYWPNPLIWHAARRLAAERERACDDRVLAAGSTPEEYALHLVGLARRLRTSSAAALAMQGRDTLADRVGRIVQPGTDRRPLSRLRLALIGAGLIVVALAVVATEIVPGQDLGSLRQDLQASEPFTRTRAAWRAGALESRQAVDPLIERLSDPHPAVRGAAAWALGEIKHERAVDPLGDVLESDGDARVREGAALGLGEIGDEAAVGRLAAAFREDPDVRPAVLWALGEIDGSSAVTRLAELRRRAPEVAPWPDGELTTRLVVGRTARELPVRGTRRDGATADGNIGRFIAELNAGGTEEREAALLALGRLADPAAVDPVIELLAAPEAEVRASAAWVLGRIRSARAVDPLLERLRDDDIEVRAMAVWALDEIDPAGG